MNYLPDFRCVNKLSPFSSAQLGSSRAGIAVLSCMPMLWNCLSSRSTAYCDGDNLRPNRTATALTFAAQCLFSFLAAAWRWWCRWHLPGWLIHFVSTQCFTYEFCYVIVIAVNQVVTVVVIVVVRAALLPFLSISVWVKDSDWSIDRSHWQRRGVKRAWRRVANVANSWLLFCGEHDVCAMYVLETPMLVLLLLLLTGLCNLLINHTQRCRPTLTLHLSWRTATFLCVSTQRSTNRICETSKQKEDMTTTNE